MLRIFTAALLVLAVTACGTSAAPTPSASPLPTSSPVTVAPSAPPGAPEPSGSPSVDPSVSPQWDGHAADGLALVQFADPSSPVSQIFVVQPDGSLRQVTGSSLSFSGATLPVWSPDRTQIAFRGPKMGEVGIKGQIGIVNADGTGERQIAEGRDVKWSPDGTRILFGEVDDVTSEPTSMYVADVATGEITDLGIGFSPQWLPDGERISFSRAVQGRVAGDSAAFSTVLYVMALDGSEPTELAEDTDAFWSPDGSAVLMHSEGTLSLASADGTAARELAGGFAPVWSLDGTRIVLAYEHDQDATPILAVVNLDGQRIWSGVSGATPTWSPDGTRIAVEIPYPEPKVQILDAASGAVLWEVEGSQPAWTN